MQDEALALAQDVLVRHPSGTAQRGLGLGELGMHDEGSPTGDGTGDQREGLGAAAGGEDHVLRHGVASGQGRPGWVDDGVCREVADAVPQRRGEPGRGCGDTDVHREVDQPRADLGVAVVVQSNRGCRVGRRGERGRSLDPGEDRGRGAENRRLCGIRLHCGGESGWDGRVPGPMGVQIGGVQRRAPGAGWIEGEALDALLVLPGSGGAGPRRRAGPVEFVTARRRSGRPEDAVDGRASRAVLQGQARVHRCLRGNCPDEVMPVEGLAEIDQAGALGDGRHAGGDRVPDRTSEGRVAGEGRSVGLREAAAEVEPAGPGRERGVERRVEENRLAAVGPQEFVGLGITEGEGATAGHGDDRAGGGTVVGGDPLRTARRR